jgi:hypothetical protein
MAAPRHRYSLWNPECVSAVLRAVFRACLSSYILWEGTRSGDTAPCKSCTATPPRILGMSTWLKAGGRQETLRPNISIPVRNTRSYNHSTDRDLVSNARSTSFGCPAASHVYLTGRYHCIRWLHLLSVLWTSQVLRFGSICSVSPAAPKPAQVKAGAMYGFASTTNKELMANPCSICLIGNPEIARSAPSHGRVTPVRSANNTTHAA